MYSYLWNFWVNYSENFEREIHTKFAENFENILRKLWGRFSKSIRKFREKLTKFCSLEQILEKFVGNIWLIFLQFEKFSVIRVLTYYNWKEIKKNLCKAIWISFEESLERIWENFIFRKFCEYLKINAKLQKGCSIFGTFNLWNFYVKYYKTFIQKLVKKRKK